MAKKVISIFVSGLFLAVVSSLIILKTNTARAEEGKAAAPKAPTTAAPAGDNKSADQTAKADGSEEEDLGDTGDDADGEAM